MKIFIAIIVSITPSVCSCQEVEARRYEFKVEVNNDAGEAVENATVTASKDVLQVINPIPISKPVRITQNTNHGGLAEFTFDSVHQPGGVLVEKSGYYLSTAQAIWKSKDPGSWTANVVAILKPVRNPIPMHAYDNIRIRTPGFGERYGFDLQMGEAVPPFGKGKTPDIELKLTGQRIDSADPENEVIAFRTEISCPNEGDGFVEFLVEDTKEFSKGSALPSAHDAPEGGYEEKIVRIAETDAKGGIGGLTNHNNLEAQKCYYFRVRTRKDADGKIVSAHYGKMYGPLEIRPAFRRYGHDISKGQGGFYIQYLYFNPTPNDRNVEFDTKRNLNPDGNVQRP